ncbi:pleckstrin homology domain-containing family A member 5 isoform X7 [Lagenorhynchus albirostris]|uniref:pleckstrin homology domain-containing family A member 5 isoform X7 n=1 Tax=Lagenorhynchus albirostris TaxID=27610 RepID=UPI0028E54F62|nr:pleckstrin homology domain-containing family A member 5 isoform X7 [Lagenorhynchus albirostris]
MAADLNLEWICSLPRSWTYGITRGGRVFFINEEAKSTTWLHPVTGEAVVTGHRRQSTDLPTGWEEAYTFEGARYYIKLQTCRLRGHGSRAQLLRGMWDLPGPAHKPVSPASAGGLSTTAPPGKPLCLTS